MDTKIIQTSIGFQKWLISDDGEEIFNCDCLSDSILDKIIKISQDEKNKAMRDGIELYKEVINEQNNKTNNKKK